MMWRTEKDNKNKSFSCLDNRHVGPPKGRHLAFDLGIPDFLLGTGRFMHIAERRSIGSPPEAPRRSQGAEVIKLLLHVHSTSQNH